VELALHSTDESLEITVQDTGNGVDPRSVDDVFSYGFSTKAPGKYGRGIGLALVRQAVQRLGGTLTITNPGGALFRVVLPSGTKEQF
jgi:sensor histidine kinase regulating citrate/malate metabolism